MAVHAHIDMMITLRQNGSSANETGVYVPAMSRKMLT